jgi:hypothetical protein
MTELCQEIILAEFARSLRQLCEHSQPELLPDTMLDDLPGIDSLRLLQAVAYWNNIFGLRSMLSRSTTCPVCRTY